MMQKPEEFKGKISLIVAVASNGAIGKDNDLLWHISEDLKRFKRITSGHTIIMGRKTFESLPNGPLPKRQNVVITRNSDLQIEGADVVVSPSEALACCKDEDEVFVIGGSSIYNLFFEVADRLYLTEVHQDFEGDTFFSSIDPEQWVETEREEHKDAPLPYSFVNLERKR